METLRLQNEIERLDHEWMMQRESLLVHRKDGGKVEPSATASLLGGIMVACFGAFWIATTLAFGAPALFAVCGLLPIVLVFGSGIASAGKSRRFNAARQAYEARRHALVQQLQAHERRS